ncbi:thiosulfate sulfurtransferase GlpE [Halobacterium hubeiense]|jgi:rhodanese-related sulfurtransferase|uniref:Thiosulfate sulfurtransferase GlpE n=2 Tax=Halobacterium TaxID=2239 RepID=A0A0U5GYI6_9EURY|nr:rhodanese-like domain-containing protein [Halobacterium hubeiense]CQH46885.1 thiosulfate sulfurtransferase GlpE [Halobacterium hubeiense]
MSEDVDTIDPETVRERLATGDDDFDLVDIRETDAYEDGHLPGAEHLTVEELEDVVAERDWSDEVVVYCYVGQTSVQAARLVEEYGNADEVASMDGGYEAWEEAVEPLANAD